VRARLLVSLFCSAVLVCIVFYLASGWSTSEPKIAKRLRIDPERVNPTIDVTSPIGVHIPRDLATAVIELRKILPSDLLGRLTLAEPRDAFMLDYQSRQWLISHWKLNTSSSLVEYFRAQGIRHPEDMTAVIFDALVRDVSGIPWSVSQELDCGRFFTEQREDATSRPRYSFHCPL
jgi:hypothetical protein